MQSRTQVEPAPQPPGDATEETLLAWPEGDPRWLFIPEPEGSSDDSEAQSRDPTEAIEAFNRVLEERQRESAQR